MAGGRVACSTRLATRRTRVHKDRAVRNAARASRRARPVSAAVASVALVAAFLAACGTGTESGVRPSHRETEPPCEPAPMVAALQAEYGRKVRIVYNDHLVCSGNLAEIGVMVNNLESATPGYSGPVGSPHGALMHYSGGSWHPVDLSKANPYCTPDGHQTTAVPAALGRVCGIQ